MRLIKPKYEILSQESGIGGLLGHIELCGRTAYQSQKDPITIDTAKKFVDMIIKRGHGAVLEHGTVYLKFPIDGKKCVHSDYYKYTQNKYSCCFLGELNAYVTTNYRVLIENNWLDDLQYQCEPTKYHEKRISVKFTIDRGVSHEFVRHRVFSFVQESTRFCNYSKEKFGNEITYIIPNWLNLEEGKYVSADTIGWVNAKYTINGNNSIGGPGTMVDFKYTEYPECPTRLKKEFEFIEICKEEKELFSKDLPFYANTPLSNFLYATQESERYYLQLLKYGWTPQQARTVLPNSLKTELIMTGTISQWQQFFDLRCAPDAHPQAREVAIPLKEEFIKQNYNIHE